MSADKFMSETGHEITTLLSAVTYFAALDAATLTAVAQAAVKKTYDAEQIVFLEGEPSAGLCIIQKGWLKAIKLSTDGREHILNFLGPGEVFNAISVFATDANPATVMALEPAVVWILPRDTMIQLLRDRPALAHSIIRDFAARVLHLVNMVEDLSLRTVEARLARLLVEQTTTDTLIRQRWATQAEMAARLGTVPDVVNRALRALTQEGLIKVERHQIQILDREGLEIKAGLDT